MIKTNGLDKLLLGTEEQTNCPTAMTNEASNDVSKNHKVLKDAYEKVIVVDIRDKRNNA